MRAVVAPEDVDRLVRAVREFAVVCRGVVRHLGGASSSNAALAAVATLAEDVEQALARFDARLATLKAKEAD